MLLERAHGGACLLPVSKAKLEDRSFCLERNREILRSTPRAPLTFAFIKSVHEPENPGNLLANFHDRTGSVGARPET